MSNFILDSVREKFRNDDSGDSSEEFEGFPDMNYVVGNTTGLDVGQIPTPMEQRIGSQSQLGGGTMELQIYNPSTFSMNRRQILDTIDQLGLDVSLHSSPELGFTSAYKDGRQSNGYEPVHDYFTKYLQELAVFKSHKNRSHVEFDIQRINPHISTTPAPATEMRMAEGVGVDPFGYLISEYKDSQRLKDDSKKDIFSNDEFLKRFYNTFLKYIVDEPFQIYQLFSRYSERFREKWRKAQAESLNQYWNHFGSYRSGVDDIYEVVKEKTAMLHSASMQDRRINSKWMDKIRQDGDQYSFSEVQIQGQTLNVQASNLSELNNEFSRRTELGLEINRLNDLLSFLQDPDTFPDYEIEGSTAGVVEAIEDALDDLWMGETEEGWDQISVEAKLSAVTNRLDIQNQQILENAQDLKNPSLDGVKKEHLENAATAIMTQEEGWFSSDSADNKSPEEKHKDMIETLLNSFEQELWKESNLMYRIIPCWLKSADKEYDNHEKFEAPKFIWEAIVERNWEDEFTDLMNPGLNGNERGFLQLLEKNEEFKRDVAAASAAAYAWAHFTQVESKFDVRREPELEDMSGEMTWMEWMARHGIGVNLESMHGSANRELKIWRPKDIAVVSHAINMTARRSIQGEDRKILDEELDECIAKVTLDLEHIASFGVDPWKEVQDLIDLEKDIAKSGKYRKALSNPNKPLSKIIRQMHLMKPGVESQQGTYHGPFRRGDEQLYFYLYKLVENGFARNQNEEAAIMYEQGEEKGETTYMARLSMNMIETGIDPDELDPNAVDPSTEYSSEKEALIARFYGMDRPNYSREWAKIEEHAFDPLKNLLQTEGFDYTWSSTAALEQGDARPNEWKQEEYQ